MTVNQVIQRGAEFLQRHGVDSPRLHSELLLAHVLKVPRLQLYLNHDRPVAEPELSVVRALVQRRAQREPLQHLVGSTSFCGLELTVSPAALIPRPETETLVELAVAALKRYGAPEPGLLDFGTGTGCVAVALAAQCPTACIHALDVSEAALALARANAERHGFIGRIRFHHGDGFRALPTGLRFDLLVSNPPYIPTADIATLQPEVRDFDPVSALDGGADGLDFYRLLAHEAPSWLNPGGGLLAEFGDGQAEAIERLFTDAGWTRAALHRDLDGRWRVVEAWRTA